MSRVQSVRHFKALHETEVHSEVQLVFVTTGHHSADPNTPETPHFHSPKCAAASALLLQMIRALVKQSSARSLFAFLLEPEIEISGCFFTVHLCTGFIR